MKGVKHIRSLDQQFAKSKVRSIRNLQTRIKGLQLAAPSFRLLSNEAAGCLEAGLILAALLCMPAMLENAVRELLVRHTAASDAMGDRLLRETLEQDLEEFYEEHKKPRYDFGAMMDRLVQLRVLTERQTKMFRQFYADIRVPLYHGLVRRFLCREDKTGIQDLFGRFGRCHAIENIVEHGGLKILGRCVRLLERLESIAEGQQTVRANSHPR